MTNALYFLQDGGSKPDELISVDIKFLIMLIPQYIMSVNNRSRSPACF